MLTLSCDTSHRLASFALCKGEKAIGEIYFSPVAELLTVKLDELLSQQKKKLSDIDLFAVTIGPGSFTGLRTGLSFIKTLAHLQKKPAVGIPTMEAMIAGALLENPSANGCLVPIIHSSGNEYYVAAYDCHQLRFIVSEQLAKVEDLSDLLPEKSLLFGEKISQLREALEKISDKRHAEWSYPELLATPSPHAVAKLALDYLTLKKNLIELTTQPNYLRSSEVERKRGEISPL